MPWPRSSSAESARRRARRVLPAVLACLAGAVAACGHAAVAADALRVRVYVAGSDTLLRVIDGADLRPLGSIPLPAAVERLAFDPARAELYALSDSGETLDVVDAPHARLAAVIPLHLHPTALLLEPAGGTAYITARADDGAGYVLALDLARRRLIARARVGDDPGAIVAVPGGTRLLVANRASRSIGILSRPAPAGGAATAGRPAGATDALRLLATVPLPAAPVALAVVPFNHTAFALCPAAAQVAAIDWQRPGLLAMLQLGATPGAMQMKPDGGELFITSPEPGLVSIVDTTTLEVAGTMGAPRGAGAMTVAGGLLYVADRDTGTVTVFDLASQTIVGSVPVGAQPVTLALAPDNANLFVADTYSSDVGVVRTDQRTLVTLLPAAPHPRALALGWWRQ